MRYIINKLKMIKSIIISKIFRDRFVAYAILLSFLFGCVHFLGFREYTGIISGTTIFSKTHQFFGMLYIILYICFVFIVPILLLAKLFLEGIKYLFIKN